MEKARNLVEMKEKLGGEREDIQWKSVDRSLGEATVVSQVTGVTADGGDGGDGMGVMDGEGTGEGEGGRRRRRNYCRRAPTRTGGH